MSTLSLDQYLDAIEGISLPTKEQKQRFVNYVLDAHSWYKHLPRHPPGTPFYFFLNRFVTCNLSRFPDGHFEITKFVRPEKIAAREPEKPILDIEIGSDGVVHQNTRSVWDAPRSLFWGGGNCNYQTPTTEYIEKFGHLDYTTGKPPVACKIDNDYFITSVSNASHPKLEAINIQQLPDELLEHGQTDLTAALHVYSADFPYWEKRSRSQSGEPTWPEEFGGLQRLEQINARSQKMRSPNFARSETKEFNWIFLGSPDEGYGFDWSVDTELFNLLKPARDHERAKLVNSVDRCCELLEK